MFLVSELLLTVGFHLKKWLSGGIKKCFTEVLGIAELCSLWLWGYRMCCFKVGLWRYVREKALGTIAEEQHRTSSQEKDVRIFNGET